MTIDTALETMHGSLSLPAYFPDATRGVVRTVDSGDLEACDVQGLVVNAFHLSRTPGVGLIKNAGGIHQLMGWRRPVASDSGGFQLMSMVRENAKYGSVSDRGIHFSDADGSREKVLFTPERSIRLQLDLGADIMVCLDDCPRPDAQPGEVEESVRRTVAWAKRCREELDRLVGEGNRGQAARRKAQIAPGEPGSRPLLFGVVQGGYDRDLRTRCAEALLEIGFDGFGFGGWPLTPEGDLASEILDHTASLTPDSLPRFALGVGKPEHIVRCFEMGWRIFDCVLPTRDARHGRLYAFEADSLDEVDLWAPGFYRFVYIRDEKHKRTKGPISTACDCPCCQRYTLAYLHHLFEIDDPLGMRLATLHNLRFYRQVIGRIASS